MAADIDFALHNIDREAARAAAEARMAESETRLMLALKGSQDALWDWDLEHPSCITLRAGGICWATRSTRCRWMRSLGFQTIAEGVETEGQLTFLREQGCDEVQGYYFSRPVPATEFESFVREQEVRQQDGDPLSALMI